MNIDDNKQKEINEKDKPENLIEINKEENIVINEDNNNQEQKIVTDEDNKKQEEERIDIDEDNKKQEEVNDINKNENVIIKDDQ